MHYICENIKRVMETRGISISEMARRSGVSKATISKWFTQEKKPRVDIVEKIADALQLPVDYFFDERFIDHWQEEAGSWEWKSGNVYEVAAGDGRINDGYEESGIKPKSNEYTMIRICGDSMSPSILDGDLLSVHLITDGIQPKDFAIVKVNGDEVTCKHIEITNEGIWLRAENKEVFQDKFYSVQEVLTLPVTIIGVATELISRKL